MHKPLATQIESNRDFAVSKSEAALLRFLFVQLSYSCFFLILSLRSFAKSPSIPDNQLDGGKYNKALCIIKSIRHRQNTKIPSSITTSSAIRTHKYPKSHYQITNEWLGKKTTKIASVMRKQIKIFLLF